MKIAILQLLRRSNLAAIYKNSTMPIRVLYSIPLKTTIFLCINKSNYKLMPVNLI